MSISEANELMNKYVELRNQASQTKNPKVIRDFKKYERFCIEQFRYLVTLKTGKYRNFNNYEDLKQEGLEALIKAMQSYKPERGIFFYWAHKYIDTRIARSANLHTAIRYPLKFAKETAPYREAVLPLLIDGNPDPHQCAEQSELLGMLQQNISKLSEKQRQMVHLMFGMNGEQPHSLTGLCEQLQLSRMHCVEMLGEIMSTLQVQLEF